MERKLISFDWAMKKILRSKANFKVLEGFLSELLETDIKIENVLDGESNKEDKLGKFNRVDLLVKDSKGELIIIEVQYEREYDFFQRMLYGASKVLTEHISAGDEYIKIKKIISVNIVYFNLGQGEDYVYTGTTQFIGRRKRDILQLVQNQKEVFGKDQVSDIFPTYYLLKVNNFDDMAKDKLDEWIYFFKNSEIKENFNARGLKEANKILDVTKLSKEERREYDNFMESLRDNASWFQSSFGDGHRVGKEEGRAEGKAEGKNERNIEIAKASKAKGLPMNIISEITGLSISEIENL